jgi:Fe-S-cluster containining protein
MSAEGIQGTTGKSPEALFLNELVGKLENAPTSNIGSLLIGYMNGTLENYFRNHEEEIACAKGCNHCCKMMVALNSAEAVALYRHLVTTRAQEKLDRLKLRLKMRVETITGMNQAQYWEATHEEGCLFLNKEGACTVYAVRPRACSSLVVRDAQPCRDHAPVLQRHSVPMNISLLGYIAVSRILRKRGLQSGMYEMNSALHTLFSDPTAADRWENGQEVFMGNMAPELDDKIHLEVFNGS